VLGSILSQVFIGASLHDGEQRLVMPVEGLGLVEPLHAALQPSLGQPQTLLGILVVALSRRALVEGHHDVGSDDALRVHHVLWREEVL